MKPDWESADVLRQATPEFYQIGDSLLVRNILVANQEGYYVERDIGRF